LNTTLSHLFDYLKKDRAILISIFVLAISVRLVYCYEISGTPFFTALIGDAGLFDSWAKEIAGGKWSGKHVVLQPFYPYFLALIYFTFGHNLFAVQIIQILIGATSCLLIAKAGSYFFSRKVGILAGFLLAFFPSAIFFDCLIQKTVFGIFFISLLFLFLGKIMDEPRNHRWILSGITLGLLVLVRENALVLVPAMFLWVIVFFRDQSKMRLILWIMLTTAGLLIVFFPVGLKNKINTGKFSIGASHFGPNLYMGNNPKAKGIYVPLAIGRGNIVSELEDITNIAEKETGKSLKPNEVSWFWIEKTLRYIQSDPMHWVRLLLKKWALVWNAIEIADTVDIYAYEKQSVVLRLLNTILHLGILLPLAMIGVYATWNHREKLWLLYLSMMAYAAGLTLFFVFSRYRYPIIAIIILFASAGILNLRRVFLKKSIKEAGFAGGIILCAAIFFNWQIIPERISSATTYYNLAKAYEGGERQDKAVQYYRTAIDLVPNFSLAHNNLGVILADSGRQTEAIGHFNRAVSIEPGFADAYNNLGAALSSIGALPEAISCFKKALRIKPGDAAIHNNLAIAYFKKGRLKKSYLHFQQAHKLNPGDINIADNLRKVEEKMNEQ